MGWLWEVCEMLEDDILPVLRSKSGNSFTYNAWSVLTKSNLKREKIELIEDWPAQSPDINPIEDNLGLDGKEN